MKKIPFLFVLILMMLLCAIFANVADAQCPGGVCRPAQSQAFAPAVSYHQPGAFVQPGYSTPMYQYQPAYQQPIYAAGVNYHGHVVFLASQSQPTESNPWQWTDEEGGYWWRWKTTTVYATPLRSMPVTPSACRGGYCR